MAVDIGPRIGIDGEQSYKKAIAAIIQQQKELASECKAVVSGFDDTTSAQERAEKTSAEYQKQLDLLRQKERLVTRELDKSEAELKQMAAALEKTKAETGEASKETQKAQSQYNAQAVAVSKLRTTLNNTTADINTTAEAMRKAGNAAESAADGLDSAEFAALSMGDVFKASFFADVAVKALEGVAAAAGKVKAAITDTIKGSAAYADTYLTMATVTGLSTDTLQEFAYMSELVDVSLDTITGSLTKVTVKMGDAYDGSKSAQAAFDALGVSVVDADGNMRSAEAVFYDAIDALREVENTTQRDALAMDLFGKSAQDLNPLIAQGADALNDLAVEAYETGYVLDSETLSSLGAVDDGFQRLDKMAESVQNRLGASLAPVVTDVSDKLLELADSVDWNAVGEKVGNFAQAVLDFGEWMVEHGSEVASLVAAVGAGFVAWNVVSMVQGLSAAIVAFAEAQQAATLGQAILNAVLSANPIGIVITAVTALTAGVIALWTTNDDFRESVVRVATAVKDTVLKIVDTVKDLIKKAYTWGADFISGLIDGIKSKVSAVTDAVSGIAGKIANFLHFSRPDMGPLREYEKWMPDMIDGMAKSLRAAQPVLMSAVRDVAAGMSATLNVAASGGRGISIGTVNAYGYSADNAAQLVDALDFELGRRYG